jgi:hypothetical protein
MNNLLKIFLALSLIGMIGKACGRSNNSTEKGVGSGVRSGPSPSTTTKSSAENVLDAGSASSCENYLKGRTFTGGSARLEFGYDGSVSAYDGNGRLVFGGTVEVGAVKSAVSRWIHVRDISGGGKLQFLLSNDGNMMEPSSLVIYKPQ